MRAAFAVLMATVFLGILGGCGYRMVSYPKRSDSLGVAIQNFDNESFDYGYEFVLADAMRKEFARRGAWKLVNDPGQADLLVTGSIRPVTTARRSFSSVVSTLEYEVGVVLNIGVSRPGIPLEVDSRIVRERELYLASADIEVTRRNRDEALRRVASSLAVRIHDVLYEVAPEPDVSASPPVAESIGSAVDDGSELPEPVGDETLPPTPPSVDPAPAGAELPESVGGQAPPSVPPPSAEPRPPPPEAGQLPPPVESEGVGEARDWTPSGEVPPPLEAEDPVPGGGTLE